MLWWGWLWWLCAGIAQAQTPASPPSADAVVAPAVIQLEPGHAVALEDRARYWIGPPGSTIEEVDAAQDRLAWRLHRRAATYNLDGRALWLQFDVQRSASDRWYVELASSGLDRVQLFYRGADGQWIAQEAGDSRSVNEWPLPGRFPTFELAGEAGRPVRYWLRIEHERVDFATPVSLQPQAKLLASREREQFLLGAYFSLAVLIAAVAAVNALVFRDRSFAAYAIYVGFMAVGQAAYLGVGAQHLWAEHLAWNATATFLLPGIGSAAALWFAKVVTEPARFSRALDLAVWSLIAAVLSAVALDSFLQLRSSFSLVMALTLVALVVVMGLIALVWTQGEDPEIRLIALGFLPVIVMATFPIARGLNLIPASPLTRYGLSLGAALEMPILYYALTLRGSRRREAQVRAAALSRTDALTGLAHLRTLLPRLADAISRAHGLKHHCALVVVRIANFGAIAGEFGRETGERALVVTASHLRLATSDVDMAARIGEHDFAVLLEGPTTRDHAMSRAQQIVVAGLRQADALPPGVTLRYNVAVALLPDAERQLNAEATLRWMADAVAAMPPDARKQIKPLNF